MKRWEVLIFGREVLTVSRKPITPCNHIGKRSTASQAVKWLSSKAVGNVEVFTKRSIQL